MSSRTRLLLLILCVGVMVQAELPARGQCISQEQAKLTASDAAATDWFGYSVAISGDTAVIGAVSDEHAGGTDAGSAYVFVRSGGVELGDDFHMRPVCITDNSDADDDGTDGGNRAFAARIPAIDAVCTADRGRLDPSYARNVGRGAVSIILLCYGGQNRRADPRPAPGGVIV